MGVIFTREEEINRGAGVKLHGTVDNQPIAIVLYYNRNKGTSSKVVFEKIPDGKKVLIQQSLSASMKSAGKTIPIHTSITIPDMNLRKAIRESLISANLAVTECAKQSHMDYHAKVRSGGNELTITQYSSGALVLQGAYSDLVERVVEVVDKIKPLSAEERALLYVPEDSKESVRGNINQGASVFKKALATAESARGDYVAFLFDNDRKSLITGEALTEILEGQAKALPEYNFLVAIYAKVFEGFVIRLLIEKDFFSSEAFIANPDVADIGNALRNRKLQKYIQDTRRYGFVIEKLISVWEGSRCKEMHSDPAAEQEIISVGSLSDAKNRIGEIKSCMKDAYDVLVKYGLTDRDLKQEVRVSQPVSRVAVDRAPRGTEGAYIGTDESGKGDYFGPLVVAGVFLDPPTEKRLADAGVRDSKKISDSRIHEYAGIIRSYVDKPQYSVVAIGPEKYNDLYAKIGNLNRLLAWGHARSIENILAAVDCNKAIADQFGDESYINKALLEKGKRIALVQMPKAEQHTAVAAASILARETFLLRLAELSKEVGMGLPKGASPEVEAAAKLVVEKHGMAQLAKCAKLHFKTTEKLHKQT